MSSWKDHYALLERQMIENDQSLSGLEAMGMIRKNSIPVGKIDNLPEVRIHAIDEPKPKRETMLSRGEIRSMLFVKHLIEQEAARKEAARRAKEVKQINPNQVGINPASIESFIVNVLSETKDFLEISTIIERAKALGWDAEAFIKNCFLKVLRDNAPLVQKNNTSFKLREGLRGTKPTKEQQRLPQRDRVAGIAKLSDVIYLMAKRHQKEKGTYPGHIHYIMNSRGLEVSYTHVRRVMQSDRFTRSGYLYKTKE